MCGGGGSAPEDKSDIVAQIQAEAAREQREFEARQAAEARAREQREQAQALSDFEDRLGSAFSSGVSGAERFFTQRGLDPSEYRDDILSEARNRRSQIPELSGEVGSYFSDLGESVYSDLVDALRGQSTRAIQSIAPEGFARSRIADTADDDIINSILAEQRADAEGYAQRLLDRGVITDSGFNAALEDLEKQANRGRFTLEEFGKGLLEGGRGDARNIVNRGLSRASGLELGESFDPYSVGTELDTFFSDFMTNLGNRFRASAPENLFDVSGLPVLAGATQGAGNTAFDPAAVAGLIEEEEEEEEEETNPFGVF